MGKIEAALERAKELHKGRGSLSPSRQSGRAQTNTTATGIHRQIWPGITQIELDKAHMARNRVSLGTPERTSSQMAYNMLRTRLIRRMRANDWRSILVTSPNAGAGKSLTSLNLAISLSREHNHTAYVVDLDLRNPSLHHYLGVKSPPGSMTRYLVDGASLSETLVSCDVPRLYFALNGVSHQHSAELLTSQRMLQFVEELKAIDPTGIIIYDMPPVLVTDDVLAFSPYVDAVLLVAAEGGTKRDELEKSIALLEDAELVGVVLNKAKDIQKKNAYY